MISINGFIWSMAFFFLAHSFESKSRGEFYTFLSLFVVAGINGCIALSILIGDNL